MVRILTSDRRVEYLLSEIQRLRKTEAGTETAAAAKLEHSGCAHDDGKTSKSAGGKSTEEAVNNPRAVSSGSMHSGEKIIAAISSISAGSDTPLIAESERASKSSGNADTSRTLDNADEESCLSGALRFKYIMSTTPMSMEKIRFKLTSIRRRVRLHQKLFELSHSIHAAFRKGARESVGAEIASFDSELRLLREAEKEYVNIIADMPEADLFAGEADRPVRCRKISGVLGVWVFRCLDIIPQKLGSPEKRESYYIVRVDGIVKYTSRVCISNLWNESPEIKLHKASVFEISVHSKRGKEFAAVGLMWFYISDLVDHMLHAGTVSERSYTHDIMRTDPLWLEMEPASRVLICFKFEDGSASGDVNDKSNISLTKGSVASGDTSKKSDTNNSHRDSDAGGKPLRRVTVVRPHFPRFSHLYYRKIIFGVMMCSICLERCGKSVYICEICKNAVHPKCHKGVVWVCIAARRRLEYSLAEMYGSFKNYNIPHIMASAKTRAPTFCCHCGHLMSPNRKVLCCEECKKHFHIRCAEFVPNFCGLTNQVASAIITALEQHEIKRHMDIIEKAKRDNLLEPTLSEAVCRYISTANDTHGPSASSSGKRSSSQSIKLIPKIPQKAAPENAKKGHSSAISAAGLMFKILSSQRYSPKSHSKVGSRSSKASSKSLSDYTFISVLGRGAFGTVFLARDNETRKLYALKALKKSTVLQNGDLKSLKVERNIFLGILSCKFPYLVYLDSIFQSDAYVFFAMEYANGGDLMALIMRKKRFFIEWARFYSCEILLVIEYFHSRDIIYRDLKLDNILLCSDGHIKIADYGICKENIPYGHKTTTFCGTPDYMAPEVLMNTQYDRSVDWWSFGVLLYVMVAGRYPFRGEGNRGILKSILNNEVHYPSFFSSDLVSLLKGVSTSLSTSACFRPPVVNMIHQKLLETDHRLRLGSGPDGAEQIKSHPFYKDVNWDSFYTRSARPPWKPTVVSATPWPQAARPSLCFSS